MELFIDLLTYFLIYSFLGWCIESIYKSFCEKRLVNSGFLYGPFCPIYGYGAIIMYIFLEDVSSKPIITFCLGFVVLSVWEYVVGVFLEKVFHRKYWDYSNYKLNLQGRVCLLNSIFWGILGVLFIDIIHPFVLSILAFINRDIIFYIDIAIFGIILIDTIISISSNFSIIAKLKRVEELTNTIKSKLEEIKQKGKGVEQSLQETLDELDARRAKIIRKSYRTIIRLKRAFPSMRAEEFTKFLNEKKDLFKKP